MRRVLGVGIALLCAWPVLAQKGLAPTERMTKEQFDKLPPSQVLTIGGKQMTKAEFLAIVAKVRLDAARMRRAPSLAELNAAEAQKHKATIAARNRLTSQRAAAKPLAADWSKVAAARPLSITDVVVEPPLSPGSKLEIVGAGFGEGTRYEGNPFGDYYCYTNETGWAATPAGAEARLYGNFPGGFVKLEVSNWHAGCISASVPGVSGVLPQQATVRVVVGGRQSNGVQAAFQPARECKYVATKLFRCTHLIPPGGSDPECHMTEISLQAHHAGYVYDASSDGIEIALPLRNGWQLDKAFVGVVSCDSQGTVCAANLEQFEVGVTKGFAIFGWSYATAWPALTGMRYSGFIQACGPDGTPYT